MNRAIKWPISDFVRVVVTPTSATSSPLTPDEQLLLELDDANSSLQQQLAAAQTRIKELTQGDPAWYDMSEADAFRMWAEDRKKLAELEQRLKDTPA